VTDSINNPEVAMDQNKKWEPSLFRTAIFRLLSGVICLAIVWMFFNAFSWATVLPHGYLLLYMGVFALLGYDGFAITDAMESRIGNIIYWGVKG